MSQTTQFNYIYRTMKMLEHLAELQGFEYDQDGKPSRIPEPDLPPILPGPVEVVPPRASDFAYGFRGSRVVKLQELLNEEYGAALNVDGRYGPETALAHRIAQRQEAPTPTKSQHKINHLYMPLTDADYCARPVLEEFCGGKQADHLTPKKAKEVEYTPNCFACGVARFFGNKPVPNSSHGTACQYFEG